MNVAEEEEEQDLEPPPTIADAVAGSEAPTAAGDEDDDGEELDTVIYGGDTEFSPRYSPRPEVQGFSFDGSNYSI